MAGIGIGMFLFGCVLGMIVTCIWLRRRKPLKPPFSMDRHADEFKDDTDDNAL